MLIRKITLLSTVAGAVIFGSIMLLQAQSQVMVDNDIHNNQQPQDRPVSGEWHPLTPEQLKATKESVEKIVTPYGDFKRVKNGTPSTATQQIAHSKEAINEKTTQLILDDITTEYS